MAQSLKIGGSIVHVNDLSVISGLSLCLSLLRQPSHDPLPTRLDYRRFQPTQILSIIFTGGPRRCFQVQNISMST